jgi:hypothetical protein
MYFENEKIDMRTKILFILIVKLLVSSWSWSQDKDAKSITDSIRVVKLSFNVFQFYVGERKVLSEDIENLLLKEHEVAYAYFQKADRQSSNVNMFQIFGGSKIALPFVSVLFGRQPKWGYAIAGGVLLITGAFVHQSAFKNYKKAVRLYNEKLSSNISLLNKECDDEVKGNVHFQF